MEGESDGAAWPWLDSAHRWDVGGVVFQQQDGLDAGRMREPQRGFSSLAWPHPRLRAPSRSQRLAADGQPSYGGGGAIPVAVVEVGARVEVEAAGASAERVKDSVFGSTCVRTAATWTTVLPSLRRVGGARGRQQAEEREDLKG